MSRRFWNACLLGALLASGGTVSPSLSGLMMSPAHAALPMEEEYADLAEKVSPAVVNIAASGTVQASPFDGPLANQFPPEMRPLLKDFLKRGDIEAERKISSVGSGFIVDAAGFVVTNVHVIKDADNIDVILKDGTKLKAQIVGKDPKTDIVVLKVNAPKPLPFLTFGDSDKVRPGNKVMAIGNPLGVGQSVTSGIISAINRNINVGDAGPYVDYIQTDADINPGNSGGPLINMQGQVIGVNKFIVSTTGASIGIGFSIPASTAQKVVTQLQKTGRVERGWLGVNAQMVTAEIAESLGFEKTQGALITAISPDSPAAKAGLQKGDIILEVNGTAVTAEQSLPKLIANLSVDAKASLKIMRKGETQTKEATIGRLKEEEDQMSTVAGKVSRTDGTLELTSLGIAVHGLDEKIRQTFGISQEVSGVIVTDILKKNSPLGVILSRGDLIVEAQQMPVSTPEELKAIVASAQKAGRRSLLLGIARQKEFRFVSLPLQSPSENKE